MQFLFLKFLATPLFLSKHMQCTGSYHKNITISAACIYRNCKIVILELKLHAPVN